MNNYPDSNHLEQLIKKIKQKKELNTISDDFVREIILSFLSAKKISLVNLRSKEYKLLIKQVRSRLRRSYGLFRNAKETAAREKLMAKLFSSPSSRRKEIIIDMLQTHSSTKERIPFYQQFYAKLFEIIGRPKIIIDLGCGINPFSIPFMKLPVLSYYAYDISNEEISLLNSFFALLHSENRNFRGTAEIANILYPENLAKGDVCFLFKMTDILDFRKGHKITERVIDAVNAPFVVVSFSTRTMSGKAMNAPRRRWMEWLCRRKNYKYTIIEFPDEIFYAIQKHHVKIAQNPQKS